MKEEEGNRKVEEKKSRNEGTKQNVRKNKESKIGKGKLL